MSINIRDVLDTETKAYRCWYNYNYGKNSLGITKEQYALIIDKYSDSLNTWSKIANDDDNVYEISDEKRSAAESEGKEYAANEAGYEGGGKAGMITRAATDATASVAGAASQKFGAKILGKSILGHAGSAGKGMTSGAAASKAASFVIAAPLALATAVAYFANKVNEEQMKACEELNNNILLNTQDDLANAQENMQEIENNILESSEEAEKENEAGNKEIEQKKTDFDAEREIYNNLMAKIARGEKLTEDEKQWLKEHAYLMNQISAEINEIADKTSEKVNELYDDMETKGEEFDDAAESISESIGVTEYAESFDQRAHDTSIVAAVSHGINAASGYWAGIQAAKFAASGTALFGATAWAWAFAAMGVAAGAMSTKASTEQLKWANGMSAEIKTREATQALIQETDDSYGVHTGVCEDVTKMVDEFELEIPEDLEVPEGVTTEGEGAEETQPDTGLLQEPEKEDDNDKKKKENDK